MLSKQALINLIRVRQFLETWPAAKTSCISKCQTTMHILASILSIEDSEFHSEDKQAQLEPSTTAFLKDLF